MCELVIVKLDGLILMSVRDVCLSMLYRIEVGVIAGRGT